MGSYATLADYFAQRALGQDAGCSTLDQVCTVALLASCTAVLLYTCCIGIGQVALEAAAMGYHAVGVEKDAHRHESALVCAASCVDLLHYSQACASLLTVTQSLQRAFLQVAAWFAVPLAEVRRCRNCMLIVVWCSFPCIV